MIQNLLRQLAAFLFAEGIAYLKDPNNRKDIEEAGVWVAEKIAAATPNKIDDVAVGLIADGVAGKLNLADIEQKILGVPNQVVAQLPDFVSIFRSVINQAMSRLPFPFNGFQI